MTYLMPAAVRMVGEWIRIFDGEGNRTTIESFEVDTRTAVNKTTKGRVVVHRPRFEKWGGEFFIKVNLDVVEPATIQQYLNEGGELVGIGSFRPEKGGPFGTFNVSLWEETSDSKVNARKRASGEPPIADLVEAEATT